jgi:hypothetical protein
VQINLLNFTAFKLHSLMWECIVKLCAEQLTFSYLKTIIKSVIGMAILFMVCHSIACACGTIYSIAFSPRVNYTDQATAACRRS